MLKAINYFRREFLFANSIVLLTASSSLAQFVPPPPPTEETREQNQEVYQFQAPRNSPSPLPKPRQSSPSNANMLFRVQVYGSSEQLLSLVRRVEPDAFVREGKDAIQAGLFSDAVNAIQLVQSLSEQGIEANIIKISKPEEDRSDRSNSSPREYISLSSPPETPEPSTTDFVPIAVESSSLTTQKQPSEEATRGYYVVIPTREEKLTATAQVVEGAGVNQNLIEQRNAPRGNHIAVGPFPRRGEASRWSSHLKNQGLNARVYFSR